MAIVSDVGEIQVIFAWYLKKKNIVQEYDSTVEIYGVTGNIL